MFGDEVEMRTLIVGAGYYPIFEKAIYDAFLELGYKETEMFCWNAYLSDSIFSRIQNKFQIGPRVTRFNRDLVRKCEDYQPDLVFIYTGILVFPGTIKAIKHIGRTKVFSYNNDDPFAEFYPFYHWRHYKKSIPVCDRNFVFRKKNIEDIRRVYNLDAELLRAYYIDRKNYLCSESELLPNVPEVVFMGHYEDDERCRYINELVKNGIKVGVPEEHYAMFAKHSPGVISLRDNRTLYNQYLCSCKIPLIFLSKINHDTYTTRCFEIPAAGALIFSPYNEDMESMFADDKEAVYYRNEEEFVKKVNYYLLHDAEREAIAKAGRERLLKDGHEAKDRVRKILKIYDEVIRETQ